MKRRISSLILLVVFLLAASSCSNRQVLLFLNWGEYIDESLIEAFEKKENCTVVMDLGESNEIFYSKVSGGTTVYDVVCPSDYMVEKMVQRDMLSKIDLDLVPTYKEYLEKQQLLAGVQSIAGLLEAQVEGISEYYVPYLWGTWGIMYSTRKAGLEEAVLTQENAWSSLFDRSSLPANTRVAMYDSHQHAYYAACRYLGLNHTEQLSSEELKKVHDLVKTMDFDAWGTDNIKKDIVAQNIDLGFMWTGDFLYYYCETIADIVIDAYINGGLTIDKFADMIHALTKTDGRYTINGTDYTVGFDIFIPEDTIAFCDNLVITKDASHKDLAHKFIDFMCSQTLEVGEDEVRPAYANTYYVCYNTPYLPIYEEIISLSAEEFTISDETGYQEERNNGTQVLDTTLYNKIYDYATGLAFQKYYPKNEVKGSILQAFPRSYVNTINTTFNNARA